MNEDNTVTYHANSSPAPSKVNQLAMATPLNHQVEHPMITLFSYASNLRIDETADHVWLDFRLTAFVTLLSAPTSERENFCQDDEAADDVVSAVKHEQAAKDMQCQFALLDEIKHLLEPKKTLRISVKTMKLLITLFQLLTAFATLLSEDMQCKFALLDEIKHLLEPKKTHRIFVKTMKVLITLFQLLTAFATLLSEDMQWKFALLDEIKHLLEAKKILRIFVKTMKLLMTLFQL
ncbi:hypothetical protein T11_11793 [Trichinella zimbabwensis]|uniref:Uncharacterized protein n=1 Tax=Trichinella zimbabwensis TaxID=268475 RepID=A0A0V1GSG0_9BILA|nr:hypothetical protein T11_11793 [Trichinella zimbabwensis]